MTVMISEPRSRPWLRTLLLAFGAILAVAALVLLVSSLLGEKTKPRKQTVHQIAILRPPPPPPPPKPQEKQPEPEIKKDDVKIEQKVEQPRETPSEQPEGKQLGVDAEGSSGSDGFGLAANKGGRDLLAGGSGGAVGRAGFAFYTAALQRHLHDEIAREQALRSGEFRVVLRLWLGRDGSLQRFEMVGSSGNAETDELIKTALKDARPIKEPPPENMPQPIKVRITARGMG